MKDEELVRGALKGYDGCLSDLLAGLRTPVFTLLLHKGFKRADAEDLCQVTLLRIARKLHTYDPAKGTLQTWALKVADSRALDEWVRRGRGPVELRLDDVKEPSCPGPQTLHRDLVLHDRVWKAVCSLPLKLRAVVVMFYYWRMSKAEIAGFLGVSEGTVRYRLRTAHARLRRVLTKLGVRSSASLNV